MLKKFIFVSLIFLSLAAVAPKVFAADQVEVYFYWAEGCPHCEKEKTFLAGLMRDDKYRQTIVIKDYEVVNDSANLEQMEEHLAKFDQKVLGVPMTIIGEKVISGFATAETTGQAIKTAIDGQLPQTTQQNVEKVIPGFTNDETTGQAIKTAIDKQLTQINQQDSGKIALPLLGMVDPQSISLPLLTAVIGFLDGFNPCAMWALLFLISMLLNMQNRKRMWILGSVFIITSALMYFVFMAAWLNFILFVGVVFWVRILIGAFALGGGGWNLKKYFTRKDDSGCEVTGTEKRRQTFERMKEIVYKKNFLLAIVGMILLAFSVNLVELICSAGLPAVYTQVLAMNNLPVWQYYGYLIVYVFFFMLDDLLVFFIAMTTLRATGISTRYSKWSSLIGGIIMLIIGLLLIFKPEWLMFG